MRAIKAVVFDLDGVVIDSEFHWKKVEFDFLKSLVKNWNESKQRELLGMSVLDAFHLLRKRFDISIKESEFLEKYDEMARDIYRNRISIMPGCLDAIGRLRKNGLATALATSSSRKWVDWMLERLGNLRGAFDIITCSDDVDGKKKPSPEIYLHTAKEFGVPPASCAAIEDSRSGLLSARLAGMKCIGYRNGFNDEQDLSGADFVMRDFGELTVERLNGLLES